MCFLVEKSVFFAEKDRSDCLFFLKKIIQMINYQYFNLPTTTLVKQLLIQNSSRSRVITSYVAITSGVASSGEEIIPNERRSAIKIAIVLKF
ncbi:MAG: hypothetical protein DHS20C18_53920 [Saprospiraceae bacterium]|nr:MAG: hypothetical protein DHS20C18_53920 [Saprospiraceae bacterium]